MLDNLLQMTWYNPIFMIVLISVTWFLPGIVLRGIAEKRYQNAKSEAQAKKISRLYPKKEKE